MGEYTGPERRVEERIAAIEKQLEMHHEHIGEIGEQISKQVDAMVEIQISIERMNSKLEHRIEWSKDIVAEYQRAMVSISKRFEAGDAKFELLTEINKNFAWFQTMMNRARDNFVLGTGVAIIGSIFFLVTLHWAGIGDKLIKWISK
jgi:chromosome segregation ATPase